MLIGSSELQVISAYQPKICEENSLMNAAVAVILRDKELPTGEIRTEFLMMQRAFHERDPWSGQMAFPGGKLDPNDEHAKATAIREVAEEVGIDLQNAEYIGQLDDLYGLKSNGVHVVHVACFVFRLARSVKISANYEVADTVWLPFSYLNDAKNKHDYVHPKDHSLRMSAVMINREKDQILWGLSLRVLVGLYELLGWPMAVISEADRAELKSLQERKLDKSKLDKNMLNALNQRKQ